MRYNFINIFIIFNMYNFWENIIKFPKFIISVFVGFFLTTIYPIFKLLKNKRTSYLIGTTIALVLLLIYITLKLMLGYSYM
uniref:Uncharacterized protein ycf33 n=1 Tax=Palmaria palmata TaxID=2822 RepID=A0A1C9CHC5_PALPL|nr:hypothetical protein Palma_166 [Palmaria palmata]AOM67798.1 hypothetical protein Palma_166 [Palmaria palmata]